MITIFLLSLTRVSCVHPTLKPHLDESYKDDEIILVVNKIMFGIGSFSY